MKLYTKCKHCKEDILVKSSSNTRPELRSEKGDSSSYKCKECNRTSERHVNEVRARVNQNVIIGGALLGIAVTGVLWFLLGAIGTISVIIPLYIYNSQLSAVQAFNSYMVRSYPQSNNK